MPLPSLYTILTSLSTRSYTNQTSGIPIDFYEIHIKPFQTRPYPNLGVANMVGYEGKAPGPTFRIQKGRETLVRFVNEYDRPSSIHLHGSPSRTPFDGWAEDTIQPGQYKVSCRNSPGQYLFNGCIGLLLSQLPIRAHALVPRSCYPHHGGERVFRTSWVLHTVRPC